MLCPKCQTENLHQSSIGLTVCLKCGYILQPEDQIGGTNQPKIKQNKVNDPYIHNSLSDFVNNHEDAIYQSFDETTESTSFTDKIFSIFRSVGYSFGRGPKSFVLIFTALFVVLMITLFSVLFIQNGQGNGMLNKAKEQSQAYEYDNAHDTLQKAQKKWSFKSTKKAINDEIAKVERWQKYREDQIQGEELIASEDYSSAITILEPITEDYPQYPEVQYNLELAYSKLKDSGQYVASVDPEITVNGTSNPTVSVATPSTVRRSTAVRPPTTTTTINPPIPTPTQQIINPIISNGVCTVDASQATDMIEVAKNMAAVCQIAFPALEKRLGAAPYAAPHKVVLGSSSYALNGVAYVRAGWMRTAPSDMATMVHQLSLIVQNYPISYYPWLREGIADYMTFDLGYSNSWLYPHCDSVSRYNTAPNCTAAYLKYIKNHHNFGSFNVETYLNTTMRNQTFNETLLKAATGKSFEQLYSECLNYDCRGGKVNP